MGTGHGKAQAWVLLIYTMPREPTAPRVAVWRKLKKLGALRLHDAAWVLPATPALLAAYAIRDPILARIARIIDEADTVTKVELKPAAPGFDLLCRGLRRISLDDATALERGALLYEALYAELAAVGRDGDGSGEVSCRAPGGT